MNKNTLPDMTRRNFLSTSSAIVLGTMASTMSMPLEAKPDHKLATSKKGMVTSPHELATRAGLDVLKSGGNAIEAAIAIASSLNVTYPHFTGFGGDAFMIISDRNGKVRTLSGIGQAPQVLPGYSGKTIPTRGAQSMLTTAANVDTLGKAFDISRNELGGKKSWAELLKQAIAYARDGFPVSESERFWMEYRLKDMASMPGVAQNFMMDNRVPNIGETFRQPQLADTLETLAVRGYRDFYEGQLAERIAKGLKEAGSPLTASDLAKTQARVEPPLRVSYRGGELLANQPPTQGITTLEIMGILDRFDLKKIPEGSADYYHLLVEAVKRAFIDRRHVADPEFVNVPSAELLSAAHLDKLAGEIDMQRALPWPHVFKRGDTVYIGAVDAEGNAVSMLQTVYFDWGSGMMAGDTGILWHNRGASFSLNPAHPNALQPGKRPFHTLNPGMYLKNGKPALLYGTQGADGQPQTLTAVLTRMIDYDMDPLTALSRPRFLLGKTFSDTRDSLKLEQDAGEQVFAELTRRGHEMSTIPAQSPLSGQPGAIRIDDGVYRGAHDPRSDGRALGV
ncbi:gamma-glutamyltransferase [Oxalicibacterium solurbis]|uniref:Glutathione hydrolase proenzyme n=1 Tax=Oxalicibacterium solurbis TaxID=69280 RepID=A0A8J3F423_9BURK|nr:gamma-glutamyltransferase [Oxalicibacterium solurbis]